MAASGEFTEDRRSQFGGWASVYADGRPGYPVEVFDRLTEGHGLTPGAAVLEIGPGAGQATGPLLDAGAEVTAVESASEFCEMLRSTQGARGLRVVEGDFESVDLPAESFDLVVAATSFHWIDSQVGLGRAAEVLRPGGSLAMWWPHFGDSTRPDPFREALRPVLRRYVPGFADDVDGGVGIGAHPYGLDTEARRNEVAQSGRFEPLEQFVFSWTHRQTPAEVRSFFGSFSSWMVLDEKVRGPLLDDIEQLVIDRFDGAIERPFLTVLYTTRRL